MNVGVAYQPGSGRTTVTFQFQQQDKLLAVQCVVECVPSAQPTCLEITVCVLHYNDTCTVYLYSRTSIYVLIWSKMVAPIAKNI